MDKRNLVMFPTAKRKDLIKEVVRNGWKRAATGRAVQAIAAKKWMFLLGVVGFLLGRAMILETLTPFAIAYFAVIYYLRRDTYIPVGLALIAGSWFAPTPSTVWVALELTSFYLLVKGLEAYERSELSYAPLLVFISTLLVQLFGVVIGETLDWYRLMLVGAEAGLAFALTLVFIQAVPVLTMTKKTTALRNEEIICLMILLACIMTGAVGWQVNGLSVEHVMSRYVLLLFALVGGAPLGASVGVVAGLILSLADFAAIVQMSLLAFSGLLAGLLREGGKAAVAFGMLVGTSILSIYIGGQADVMTSTWESVLAAVLFMLTPRVLLRTIARFVPGTAEHTKTQYEYARRVRDVTAQRVAQFSEVFRQLSRSFGQTLETDAWQRKEDDKTHFMNAVAERSCATCFRKDLCWEAKFYQTYKVMTDMMSSVEQNRRAVTKELPKEWTTHCVRPHQVLAVMRQQYDLFEHDQHWRKQIQESRLLVADQLSGVSQIMEDLAKEIRREGQEMHLQEEQIREGLEGLGLSIQSVEIINLEAGNVDIEVTHTFPKGYDECRKIVAPLLSDILGEPITVRSERFAEQSGQPASVTFGSAKEFEVETGIAGAAKGGDLLSGDSFSAVELGNGKFAVAVSDGMGNGERARLESSTALNILQQLLQSGMDEKLAIKSVNSVLLLRSSDEVFATVDLALIDMYTAKTTFLKIGSTPSFIKRGNDVIPISVNNLPIGILHDIDVDLLRVQLYPGDTLIMMTDGIFDAPGHAVNKELWMKRVIQELKASDPQQMANELLDTVVRHHQGDILDDMTVVIAQVKKHQPEWATFRWTGMPKFERPRTVS
ncbi:stage II sporulation protein E [Paenibacillus darwinianus]|uniref:Stage II sporulation protein E n=1 Tax=Paenibacillus darwinianus TaxID=1380763 RepID=A0A9W5W6S3_9BACL|nr:stage II sporulation protein E [Paenibacillus darwinianus]EXX85046.1 stage II sporulation protein E [Paenibacillus darwinianus]EXX87600.1 stage II sporulation protein E [Paenibacillus darwinianus]EXX87662.1 stage II sporulation protein E [Paenibacillus darwinianus]